MSNHTTSGPTIHYRADFAAGGGPGTTLPTVPVATLQDCTSGAMTLAFVGDRWVIADTEGNVYAESSNVGDLAEWMAEYMESLAETLADDQF